MSLGIYLRKSRGRADVNFFDRSLVALADGSDGEMDGAAERSRVEKALEEYPSYFLLLLPRNTNVPLTPFAPMRKVTSYDRISKTATLSLLINFVRSVKTIS